jgi:light-regulated signal transduction histidine kinase (bacteriophytochrome)
LKANRELESFSYSVSHDLRAPLRAVDGFSQILLHQFASSIPAQGARLLNDIRANTQRMGALVDGLLEFARLGKQALKRQTFSMAKLVQICVDEIQRHETAAQTIVAVADLPPCHGDPTLLKQVWMNLLQNALKYSAKSSSPRVTVGSFRDEPSGAAVYFVQDNGVGFDMKYADKLFGVFERLHGAGEYEGTGIGLAIAHRIVTRHGGRIWFESRPNEGAKFFLMIPHGDGLDA